MSRPDRDLQQRLERLEALIRELEQGPESPVRACARDVVAAVLDLHALGLTRMMDLVAGVEARGGPLAEAFARDPLIAGLLLLHGLHPSDLETRVRGAVDALEPMLLAQGARMARLSVEAGTVRLGLEREPGRGRVTTGDLRASVEQAIIAAAPDAASVDIEMPDTGDPAAFVPVGEVRMRRRPESPP